jgi:hypothetical protein
MADLLDRSEIIAATTGEVNKRMEAAIEDLRVKYEKIDAEKERRAAEGEGAGDGEGAEGAGGGGSGDPELAAIRERRLARLKKLKAEHERNKTLGTGEYTEIEEENFLKTVRCFHAAFGEHAFCVIAV